MKVIKVIPAGSRVLLRLQKKKSGSGIILADTSLDKKEYWQFFVDAIGEGVPKDVPFKVGDQVAIFAHTHLELYPEAQEHESDMTKCENIYRLASYSDIWGVYPIGWVDLCGARSTNTTKATLRP